MSDCQFFSLITLHSLQLIEDRPEAVRAARNEDARFASEEVAAPGEDHDVFLHVAPGPVRDPFRHVSVSDEFVPDLEGVAAACTPIARAVRVGFDDSVLTVFLTTVMRTLWGFMSRSLPMISLYSHYSLKRRW